MHGVVSCRATGRKGKQDSLKMTETLKERDREKDRESQTSAKWGQGRARRVTYLAQSEDVADCKSRQSPILALANAS